MGAHDVYALSRHWLGKSEDEEGGDEGESYVDYYAGNIKQALEYLYDLQFRIKDYDSAAAFGAEVTARANAAREWVDVLEQDKRLNASAVQQVAEQVEARSARGRSASLQAIRTLILERARNNNQIYQASNARPW